MNETKIIIRDNGEMAVEEHINGVTVYKRIEPDSLIQCVAGSIARGGVSSGLLPNGFLSFTRRDDGTVGVTLLFPDSRADISYYKTAYPHFPLPRLVFGFEVSVEGRVYNCRLGVTENGGMLKPDMKMFRYPFSNVSGFQLCVGNNVLPKCKSLHTLGSLPHFILSMPNNDDYFKSEHNRLGLEMRELLEHLKDKEPEYYCSDVLIPFERSKLNDFIDIRDAR